MELTERLRKRAKHADATGQPNCNLMHEAADEIERLREIVNECYDTLRRVQELWDYQCGSNSGRAMSPLHVDVRKAVSDAAKKRGTA